MLFLPKWLFPVFHTIHNLEAPSAVFDPGGDLVSRYIGPSPSELGHELNVDGLGLIAAEPVAVLARRLGKKGNRAVVGMLIRWSNNPKEVATWELILRLMQDFLSLIWKLEDKLLKGRAFDRGKCSY